MLNARYVNQEHSLIALEIDRVMADASVQTDTLTIPVDPANPHYRKLVELAIPIAAFVDLGVLARAKRKKFFELREEGIDRLFSSAQPADTIRTAARPVAISIANATTIEEVDAIDATGW